jgi:mRNA-degrading endonuclease RelE of RelBE toxin-antitoxin system
MRAVVPEKFVRQLVEAPPAVQRAFIKQLAYLLRDLRHRSLDAKKYPESGDPDLWQARVIDWRLYFKIEGDAYHLDSIKPHPK